MNFGTLLYLFMCLLCIFTCSKEEEVKKVPIKPIGLKFPTKLVTYVRMFILDFSIQPSTKEFL